MKSCPTSINVPKFIKQITTDNVKGSAHTLLSSNVMGAGCSKVCPVEKLCEGACVYNLMDEDPIPIAKLQRYSTEMAMQKKWQLFTRKENKGKKVAVIGAGPAGLSCAHVLSREGIDLTIYEKEKQGGACYNGEAPDCGLFSISAPKGPRKKTVAQNMIAKVIKGDPHGMPGEKANDH